MKKLLGVLTVLLLLCLASTALANVIIHAGNFPDDNFRAYVLQNCDTDGNTVLCVKKGVRDKDASCSKYRYDPLKREPRRPAALPSFADNDFTLELED